MDSIWSDTTSPIDISSINFLDCTLSSKSLSPTIIEENTKEVNPKHLKLLFGADAEERIAAKLFQYNISQEEMETTTFSYYDFPPEEEAILLSLVNTSTTHLTVAINNYDDCLLLETVRRLMLKHLSHSLLSVQLYINFSHSPDFTISAVHHVNVFSLLESFNSLPRLQHLTVVIDHPIFSAFKPKVNTAAAGNPNFACDLSFIAHQLNELYFSTAEDLQWTPLLYWLARADEQHCSLTKVGLGNLDQHFLLASFASRHPVLGNAIVEQPTVTWSLPAPFVSQSFSLMPMLAHLNLKIHSTPELFSMLVCTRSLTNLQSMSLVFNTASPYTGHRPLFQFAFDPTVLPRFTALRRLKLVANVHSHSDLHSCLWPTVFPALEMLELVHNCVTCRVCPPVIRGSTKLSRAAKGKVGKMVEECLLRTFKQCPQLSFISASKDGGWWSQNYVATVVNGKKVLLKLHL